MLLTTTLEWYACRLTLSRGETAKKAPINGFIQTEIRAGRYTHEDTKNLHTRERCWLSTIRLGSPSDFRSCRHLADLLLAQKSAFCKQQATERAQIVQNSPACRYVEVEFCEVVRNKKKRLFAAFRPFAVCHSEFFFHIAPCLSKRLGEHRNIFVRPFDTVKRRLGLIAHVPRLSDRRWPFGRVLQYLSSLIVAQL